MQGNRVGLGKQPLSLAKKRISRKLQVRLPRDFQSLAMTVRSIEIATAFSKPRNDNMWVCNDDEEYSPLKN